MSPTAIIHRPSTLLGTACSQATPVQTPVGLNCFALLCARLEPDPPNRAAHFLKRRLASRRAAQIEPVVGPCQARLQTHPALVAFFDDFQSFHPGRGPLLRELVDSFPVGSLVQLEPIHELGSDARLVVLQRGLDIKKKKNQKREGAISEKHSIRFTKCSVSYNF